jgi:hypothetical protein
MAATVHEHYFVGNSDWLVTEYDPTDDIAFGWACLGGDRQNAELGYFSLAEMEQARVPLHVEVEGQRVRIGETGVERDEHWPDDLTLTDAIAHLDVRAGR